MVKFATACILEMKQLTKRLEVELGPDTGDLALRVGVHSGPVVAGVLRGDRSRFQLFGDTMNTASRMESTGVPNKIQISQSTADLLGDAGKARWFEPRKDMVEAKGKGFLQTYFIRMSDSEKRPAPASSISSSDFSAVSLDTDGDGSNGSGGTASLGAFRDDEDRLEKRDRIADWTVEVLAGLLREIKARRRANTAKNSTESLLRRMECESSLQANGNTVIDEVAEIIGLPKYDAAAARQEARVDLGELDIPEVVFEELRFFVRTIASMYRDNRKFPYSILETNILIPILF
jgi:Adenylate and Guanylate cyclase catalytic domain